MSSTAQAHLERIYEVPGFIGPLDVAFFACLFNAQDEAGVSGDVLEIGTFHGRTAILLEYLKGDRETLHVCDLFEDTPPTEAGRHELALSPQSIPTRAEFEERFRRFHTTRPVIHQGPSSDLNVSELGRNEFRFVHVDGSHVYETVQHDIAIANEIVTEGGVIAFDDFANAGYPGVGAALWPEVVTREVDAFACSRTKLYATKGSAWAARYRSAIQDFASLHGLGWRENELATCSVVSVWEASQKRSLRARVVGRRRRLSQRVLGATPVGFIPDYVFGF